jgi:phosphoribosylformylglycinamidine synthase
VREAVRAGTLSSAHDVAEGGLAVALAECCIAGELGANVELDASSWAGEELTALFGESAGGFVVSGEPAALRELAARVPVRTLGTVGGEDLSIRWGPDGSLTVALDELARAHRSLEDLFD